jgi:cell division protein FtsQ
LPGMPLEMPDPDGDDLLRPGGPRRDWQGGGTLGREPSERDWSGRPWWRPSSTVGRVFLGLCTLVLLSGAADSAFVLKNYLDRDARFRIAGASHIQAAGLTEVSRAQMLPVFGEDIGRNIFFVPLGERRRQLEEIPWIERATVMRVLPDQIRVSVVERKPVAFVRQGQEIGLVDASGVLLAMPPAMMAQHHYSFPVVTGIDAADPLPSRTARMAIYQRLMAELDANNQHFSQQISEIDLTDPEDARVLMPEQGADILAHFGEDHFLERYQRYRAHIAEWRQQYPNLAVVDLRYDQQVVLQMSPASNAAQPAADQAVSNAGEGKQPVAQPAENLKTRDQAKNEPASQTAKAKPVRTATSTRARKSKSALAKERRKRAEAERAALNATRRRIAKDTIRTAAAGQGE